MLTGLVGQHPAAFLDVLFSNPRTQRRPEPTANAAGLYAGALWGAYDSIWSDLADRALNESRSKKLIHQIAEECSRA
ncbi:hypothetical protein ACN28G_18110 [Micromonospora sp. WMMA1923]|uniref:hypothetical protein n=1 Tax=Micromonospora sp. WMMA1923 TaxID=3404125 RepID=UPI003B940863